jgi:hypothetical protein
MTTRKEKIRKLYALARDKGAFENEAAVARAKAQALEALTTKKIAHDIGQLLQKHGMVVRVRRRAREDDWQGYHYVGMWRCASKVRMLVDADVSYLRNRIYIEVAD